MKEFKLSQAAVACHGKFHGGARLEAEAVRSVSIDSRSTGAGCLFVPIKGERFDGHDFIAQAFEGGALCCLSERAVEGFPYIKVGSSLRAFQEIAGFYRGLFDIPVIGITGSVGKTSTKEMIYSVLSQSLDVLKTQGNLNNQTGVPLTLLRLEPRHEAAVIEMGTNHFGEIGAVAKITRPNYCFITNIGDAHIENFGSRQGTLRAKCEMLDYMEAGGPVFVNGDDPLLRTLKNSRDGVVTYGLSPDNDIYAEAVAAEGLGGSSFTAVARGERHAIHVPSPGAHMVLNALAGIAAGRALGLGWAAIANGIAAYSPAGSRMNIIRSGGITILDDVYNANPQSVSAALDVLGAAEGRRVAILGDMRELGSGSPRLHADTGRRAAETADIVLGVGLLAAGICEGASGGRCDTQYFPTQEALTASLPDIIRPGDTVLVKASRGMALEDTVEFLRRMDIRRSPSKS